MFTGDGMSNLQLDVVDLVTGLAELRWTSVHAGRLYQVYVNGKPAAATEDPTDPWRLEFQLPAGQLALIELIAVELAGAEADVSDQLDGFASADAHRCRLRWPRLATVHGPREAAVVYGNDAAGEIDYDGPLARLPLWPDGLHRWGRGTSPRGSGGRGYDGTAAPGRGHGSRGYGERGFDALLAEWIRDPLPAGTYAFAVRIEDEAGNASTAVEQTTRLDPPPRSGSQLSIEYDDVTDTVSLAWEASPDLA